MLVEHANQLAHQLPRMIVAGRLGYGYDFNAVLAQLLNRKLHIHDIAVEPIEGVADNYVERPIEIAGAVYHLLEYRSAVIGGGGGLDIFADDDPVIGGAMGGRDVALRWQGYIVHGLPAGADAQIQHRALAAGYNRLSCFSENVSAHDLVARSILPLS